MSGSTFSQCACRPRSDPRPSRILARGYSPQMAPARQLDRWHLAPVRAAGPSGTGQAAPSELTASSAGSTNVFTGGACSGGPVNRRRWGLSATHDSNRRPPPRDGAGTNVPAVSRRKTSISLPSGRIHLCQEPTFMPAALIKSSGWRHVLQLHGVAAPRQTRSERVESEAVPARCRRSASSAESRERCRKASRVALQVKAKKREQIATPPTIRAVICSRRPHP